MGITVAIVDESASLLSRSNPRAWLWELPPEQTGALTFHLPLHVRALEVVHAPDEVIEQQIREHLPEAFAAGLIDPPLYRWGERAYQSTADDLLSSDQNIRLHAFAEVATLGEGLAGAAFHGLIRLGYGALRRDRDEIARGLAYMRSRRQVLFSPLGTEPSTLALQPEPSDCEGMSVFNQLTIVAGSPGVLQPHDVDGPLPPVKELAQQALELLFQSPSSFLSVHAVDALHALVEVQQLIAPQSEVGGPGAGWLGSWWRAYLWSLRACTTLVNLGREPRMRDHHHQFDTIDALTQAAIASCEAHDVKVVVALRRLAEMGIIEESLALEAGAAKLSATECTA
jgi:hypothetical protein